MVVIETCSTKKRQKEIATGMVENETDLDFIFLPCYDIFKCVLEHHLSPLNDEELQRKIKELI